MRGVEKAGVTSPTQSLAPTSSAAQTPVRAKMRWPEKVRQLEPLRKAGQRIVEVAYGLMRPAVAAVLAGAILVGNPMSAGAEVSAFDIRRPEVVQTIDTVTLGSEQATAPRKIDLRSDYLKTTGSSFYRFEYTSSGEQVGAILAVPPGFSPDESYPVVVYNRGGNSDFGRMGANHLADMHDYFLNKGYVVVAAQHRGTAGNTGTDQFGGPKDIQATLDLVDIANGLPFSDGEKAFMAGHSRGGMTTSLAIKHGAEIRGAAVLAGLLDLEDWVDQRKASLGDDVTRGVYARHIPGWSDASSSERQARLDMRSATKWADELDVPLLIVHGTSDTRVDDDQAIELAGELAAEDKTHRLILIDGADHGFVGDEPKVSDAVDSWFDALK